MPLEVGTLEMFIIVHRHGARFPTKSFPNDLSWPVFPQFWENFHGHLTPTGALQHYALGEKLSKRYREGTKLFSSLSPGDMHRVVLCQTSPAQRCLFSAWSLLDSLFPGTPRYFSYYADRLDVNLTELEAKFGQGSQTLGIAIHVEEVMREDDKLFHQIDSASAAAQDFKKNECLKSAELQAMAKDPNMIALADKLYIATGSKQLAPGSAPVERIAKFKTAMTQIMIAKAHGLPVLPNREALTLTEAEEEAVARASRVVWRHWFRPVNSNKVSDGIGHAAAGYLGSEIGRLLADRRDGRNTFKMVEFSCHDTNVLALAALLGVDVEAPYFTGHWIFELHRPAEASAEWTVKVFYVPNPTRTSQTAYCAVLPRQLPLDGEYVDYEHCGIGAIAAEKLIRYLTIPGLGTSARVLHSLCKKSAEFEAGVVTREDLIHRSTTTLSDERCTELRKAFDFFDADGSGAVTPTELHSMFRRVGAEHITHDAVRSLVAMFAKDGTSEVDFAGFLGMMKVYDDACDVKGN